jgi:hypothetical protein
MGVRVLVLMLLAPLAAAASASAAPVTAPAPARALTTGCVRGLDQSDRAAVFEGQMKRVAGAARMQMRFSLQARTPDRDHWMTVAAPGFGAWVTAAPGTARYVYDKRVENLLAPASYRVTVRFRWLSASGATVASEKLRSPACKQPDPRPNLVVRSMSVQPAQNPARRRYVVLVRNTGRSAAEPSSLGFSIDGQALSPAPVPTLAAGEGTLVTMTGPACAEGAPLVAEADSDETVDESDETDDVLSRPCPAPSP